MPESPNNLLHPLQRFAPGACTRARILQPNAIPQPQRDLLVHQNDMTSTLEAHHQQTIFIHCLDRSRHASTNTYQREVLLQTATGQPVEYGAIIIHLNHLPTTAHSDVENARLPLGTILARHNISYTSSPTAFLAFDSPTTIAAHLNCPNTTLHGRANTLATPTGTPIAQVIEILPA